MPICVNCICVTALKWAFRLLSLPSIHIENAVDIFIVMLPLSSDEKSRAYKERNEELFISFSHITTLSVYAFVLN